MDKFLNSWRGNGVKLTLNSTVPVTLDGTIQNVDDHGVVLSQPKGSVFIPYTSILHISREG